MNKMSAEDIKVLKEELSKGFDEIMAAKLESTVGALVAAQTKSIVENLRMERFANGKDITGLSEKAKIDFVKIAQFVATKGAMQIDTKANEALIEEQDNRGGFLVSKEVADAILRIAASVGTVLSQAQKWPLKTDELAIPNYTGSFLTGSYLGVDVAGTVTGLTFGQAVLIVKKWQLAFVVGNDLLADATVQLADWLLAIAGESLANMIDQQGLAGSSALSLNSTTVGGPFVGILSLPTSTTPTGLQTTQYYLSNSSTGGKTHFSDYDVLVDSSNMIGLLEESILDGAAFYMHRTVWATLRVQKGSDGHFILPFAGIPTIAGLETTLTDYKGGGPIKPAGEILGYPVYTNRWMPSSTATNTAFVIFGNMKAMAFGDRGDMRVAQFESGAFGGKEVALTDQKGIVYKHRHALTVALPRAFVVAYTDAS